MTPGRHRTTEPCSLIAVIVLVAALLAVLVIAVATAKAGSHERKLAVIGALILYWPERYRDEALEVIDCETGSSFDPHAVGGEGLYYGLFQQGSWQRRLYGFGWTIRAQVKSGWRAFKGNGRCWVCNSQWPVCGRGLDG